MPSSILACWLPIYIGPAILRPIRFFWFGCQLLPFLLFFLKYRSSLTLFHWAISQRCLSSLLRWHWFLCWIELSPFQQISWQSHSLHSQTKARQWPRNTYWCASGQSEDPLFKRESLRVPHQIKRKTLEMIFFWIQDTRTSFSEFSQASCCCSRNHFWIYRFRFVPTSWALWRTAPWSVSNSDQYFRIWFFRWAFSSWCHPMRR